MVNRMLLERMVIEAAELAWTSAARGQWRDEWNPQCGVKAAVYKDAHRNEVAF